MTKKKSLSFKIIENSYLFNIQWFFHIFNQFILYILSNFILRILLNTLLTLLHLILIRHLIVTVIPMPRKHWTNSLQLHARPLVLSHLEPPQVVLVMMHQLLLDLRMQVIVSIMIFLVRCLGILLLRILVTFLASFFIN